MKVVYTVVESPHPHTLLGHLARTYSGSFFWDKKEENKSDYAVLATRADTGALIGIQKFNLRVDGETRTLKAVATFVWPLYRGINIAQKMWVTALREKKVTDVRVSVVSDRGKTLVEKLSDMFPRVRFTLIDAGERPLRSLKKGAKGAKGRRKAA